MRRLRWTTVTVALVVGTGLSLGHGTSVSAGGTAQGQPSRLGAVADRVTLQARPLVVSQSMRVTLFGAVDNGRTGEDVKIQAKDCGRNFFRVVSGAVTREGGEWFQFYSLPGPTTTLRAVWDDATSAGVTIRKRAHVDLQRRSTARFEVFVYAQAAWRKRAFIQRFERRLGTWHPVRSVVLTDSRYGWASASFPVRVPKGTRIRAVFPRSQTGSCYLPGTSNTLTR